MNTGNSLEELRRDHAAQFSVPGERVALVTLDLQILNEEGTFVRVHARGATMFETRALGWAELGIPPGAARSAHYRAPVKYLIDRKHVDWFRSRTESARGRLKRVGRQADFMSGYWSTTPRLKAGACEGDPRARS